MSVVEIGREAVYVPVSYGVKRVIGYTGDKLYVSRDSDVRAGEDKEFKSGTKIDKGVWIISSGASTVTIVDTAEPLAGDKALVQQTVVGLQAVEPPTADVPKASVPKSKKKSPEPVEASPKERVTKKSDPAAKRDADAKKAPAKKSAAKK